MSVTAVNPASTSAVSYESAKPAATPAPTAPSAIPVDTVSISAAAQKASQGGDVDHDGDSH